MKHKFFSILSALLVLVVTGFTASSAFARPDASAPESALAQTNIIYVVQYGDTLNKIAARYCTTWQAIYSLNYNVIGPNPNRIYAGMKLTVPANCNAGTATPPTPTPTTNPNVHDGGAMIHAMGSFNSPYYTVARGDWLSYIGYRFGVSWQSIYSANHLNTTTIYSGQALLIPGAGGGSPSPTPTPGAGSPERVNFAYGTSSATRTGTISGGAPKTYVLRAGAGQWMYVSGTSHGEALNVSIKYYSGQALALSGTNGAVSDSVQAYLPWTGDYYVTFTPVTGSSTYTFDVTFTIP